MLLSRIIRTILLITVANHFTYASKNLTFTDTSRQSFKNIKIECPKTFAIDTIIEESINIGAPTYNQGNHLACYRIYEGASYKIIYKYGNICPDIKDILETALEKSYKAYTDSEKAWIMRRAFDSILGVETRTK